MHPTFAKVFFIALTLFFVSMFIRELVLRDMKKARPTYFLFVFIGAAIFSLITTLDCFSSHDQVLLQPQKTKFVGFYPVVENPADGNKYVNVDEDLWLNVQNFAIMPDSALDSVYVYKTVPRRYYLFVNADAGTQPIYTLSRKRNIILEGGVSAAQLR